MDAVRTCDLTKRFGGKTAVDRFGMRVGKGDIYGFVGRNGAGKTNGDEDARGSGGADRRRGARVRSLAQGGGDGRAASACSSSIRGCTAR